MKNLLEDCKKELESIGKEISSQDAKLDAGYFSMLRTKSLCYQDFISKLEALTQPAPVSDEFLQYVTNAKEKFLAHIEVMKPLMNSKNRTEVEDLIICFGQMKERLENKSNPVNDEDIKALAKAANGYTAYAAETKAPIFNEGFISGYKASHPQVGGGEGWKGVKTKK